MPSEYEITLAPRILRLLAAVRATLMYLRTNASQTGITDDRERASAHDLADDLGDRPNYRQSNPQSEPAGA